MIRRHPAHRRSWFGLGRKRSTVEPQHPGADLAYADELRALGRSEGVLDRNPEPPAMGTPEDAEYWHNRFMEIQHGHQAAVDELFDGIVEVAGWDRDEFHRGYVEIVASYAWIDHDVQEIMTGEIGISPAKLTIPQARRARKRARRLSVIA